MRWGHARFACDRDTIRYIHGRRLYYQLSGCMMICLVRAESVVVDVRIGHLGMRDIMDQDYQG